MSDQTDQELLRSYCQEQSEASFAMLVDRHVNFVYSAALRIVRDPHWAQDVSQAVFVALAQRAPELQSRPILVGWLHRTTQNIGVKVVRSEVRRRLREQEATMKPTDSKDVWEEVAPELDSALSDLNEGEREVLLLRYFQGKTARDIAETFGISSEAAQKRVARAIERLRDILAKRGVAIGASGLAGLMSANAVQGAPAGLAAALSAAAFKSSLLTAGLSTATKAIAMTTLQKAAIAAVIVGGLTASVLVTSQSVAQIRGAQTALRQGAQELESEFFKNQKLKNGVLTGSTANAKAELARLQSKVESLRTQTNSIDSLRQEQRQLRQSLADATRDPKLQSTVASEAAQARVRYCMELALSVFAGAHGKTISTNLEALEVRTPKNGDPALDAKQFEVVFQGSLAELNKRGNPLKILMLRERKPWKNTDGKWVKTYVFADGHGEVLSVVDNDFEAWENQHILTLDETKP